MNYFWKRNSGLTFMLCLLGMLFISASTYSHDIPVPSDITAADGSEVVLVNHKDLYDGDGNFITHIHDYATRRYTQAEADEIHENNPHTRQSIIDGLPKAGDVKGVSGRSYDNPGFEAPDDVSEINKPDPTGKYENYGGVFLPNPNTQETPNPNTQGTVLSTETQQETSLGTQGSQESTLPSTITATYQGQTQNFAPTTEPESSDDEVYAIVEGEAIPSAQIDSSEYQGTWYRLLSSSTTRRGASPTHQLEIISVVEVKHPRRLMVTIRNNGRSFVDLTKDYSLILSRTDNTSATVNMRSRDNLYITPQKARGEKHADTDIALLPRKSFRKLGSESRFSLDFQYFYGTQTGYKEGDVLILSYQGKEVSRYPEAVQLAPRLKRSITRTWGSLKKP